MLCAIAFYGTNMQQYSAGTAVYEVNGGTKGTSASHGSRWLRHKSGTGFQESGDEDQ